MFYIIVISYLIDYVSTESTLLGKCTVKSDLTDSRLDSLVGNDYETTHKRDYDGKKSKFRFNFCGDGLSYATVSVEQSFEGKSNNVTVGYNHVKINSVGDDFSYIVFTDGTQYTAADSEKCSSIHREAHIMVKCPTKGHSDGDFVVVNEDIDHCFNLFELHSDHLCPKSAGRIFFNIILSIFLILFLYFISGAIYLRFTRGAQGRNQIPHLRFWTNLGHSIADKCDYLCRCQGPPDVTSETERIDAPILPM